MNTTARLGTHALMGLLCAGCGEATLDATAPVGTLESPAEVGGGAALSCRAHYGVVEEWYWDRGDGTAVEGSGILSRNCDDPEDPNCSPKFSFQLWQHDGVSWSQFAEGSYDVPLENIRGDGIDTLAFEIEPDEGAVSVAWERTTVWADTWTDEDGFYGDYSASVAGEVLGVPISTDGGNPMVSISAYGCPEPPAGSVGPSRALGAPPRVVESTGDGPGSLDRLLDDLDLWRERIALRRGARSP